MEFDAQNFCVLFAGISFHFTEPLSYTYYVLLGARHWMRLLSFPFHS